MLTSVTLKPHGALTSTIRLLQRSALPSRSGLLMAAVAAQAALQHTTQQCHQLGQMKFGCICHSALSFEYHSICQRASQFVSEYCKQC